LTRGRIPPLITPAVARRVLKGERRVSLDLGISEVSIEDRGDGVLLPDGSYVRFEELEMAAEKEDMVFFPCEDRLWMVAITDDHYYKLVPTEGAPTLEIDGVRMHRTKDTTPEADAGRKVESLGIEGGNVLDTCTGLGYTALAAIDRGAQTVVSIEISREVLGIARINPWSMRLFEDPRIHLMIGDSYLLVKALPTGLFHYIIHDPPRLSLAGHLYSLEFYKSLYRVLRMGGRLYHYTGEPGKRYRRLDIRKGVMKRLRSAGFKNLLYLDEIQGLICERVG
jgi:predicted methyltransferase